MQAILNKRIDTYEQENLVFKVIGTEYCKQYNLLFLLRQIVWLVLEKLIFMSRTIDYSQYGKLAIFLKDKVRACMYLKFQIHFEDLREWIVWVNKYIRIKVFF